MPSKPRRACGNPNCPHHARDGCHLCAEHMQEFNARRPTSTQQGYGAKWRKLRAWILSGEPLCRVCGAPATDVDHITPKARGGTDDVDNLQPLCHECHSRKTALEDGRWG